MSLIHPDERTIRIHPPIPWSDIQAGPDLVALAMLFDAPADADPLDPDERWQAVGITTAGGADWSTSYLERQLQKVVDHYGDREYSGHIEVRSTNGEGTPAWRIVVRGKHVVRLSAVLGWPPEQADGPGEDGLMEILADHNVHIGDERFIPADETDLPDVLLAWRDAAVQTVLANLGLKDEYGILRYRENETQPTVMPAENAALAVELRPKGVFGPDSLRPGTLMRRKATNWEEIPADVTPQDIVPGWIERHAAAGQGAES